MTAGEVLSANGYDDVIVFENYSYDDALVGVTSDSRAVYDYDKMVKWLVEKHGFSTMGAIEWIDYNTIRALPYYGDRVPVVIHRLDGVYG